jgi:hypothetical protein
VHRLADLLRADERRALATLDSAERVRLALRLGARDLETFRLAHEPPLGRDEADRELRRRRQAARRPSRCLRELAG